MPAKKTRPAKKKPVAKKVIEVVNNYDEITSSVVDGVTVYAYKDFTSIKLSKIKRYVDADSN